jgi:hypothetical protein
MDGGVPMVLAWILILTVVLTVIVSFSLSGRAY